MKTPNYKDKCLGWARGLVDDWLTHKPRAPKKDEEIPDSKKLYPSSLGSCLRMQWYEKKIPRQKPHRPDWELMAKLGTGFHKMIGKLFAYEEVRREPIGETGYFLCSYPDGIQTFEDGTPPLLLEFKTRDSLSVYRKDIMQVGATALLWTEAKHAMVITFLRSPRGEEIYRPEYLSPRQLDNAKKLAQHKLEALTKHLNEDILPIEEVSRGCDGCAWKNECMLNSTEEVLE